MNTNLIIKLGIEALQSLRTDKPDLYNEIMRHLLHLPLSNDNNDPRSGLLANIESLYTDDPILLSDIIMEGTGMVLVDPSLLRTIEDKLDVYMSLTASEFCGVFDRIEDLQSNARSIRYRGEVLESDVKDMMEEIYFPNRK
tara:strand:+ start:76 stop:498 length:423 start_codon:yes stop_codon:yes gene_type:complete